ncbi:MAG: carbohydrate kinase family protein [Anaerolineaceae bacterium]|nr:MAG: carbohydrate kinase family protein [Anaerolineaceae bacterium]
MVYNMKKILCIAETCCDIIFGKLDKIPTLGEEEYCKHFYIKAGGGANTPMGLSRLKVATRFLTRLGNDPMGRIVLDELTASGLDKDGFCLEEGISTPVSAVMSTLEDRCFASYGGDGGAFVTKEQLEYQISLTDHVHTYIGYCLTYPILDLCKKYNKTLSVDTSWIEQPKLSELEPILSYASFFTPNEKEALLISGTKNTKDALSVLSTLTPGVVITLGDQGSMARINGSDYRQSSVYYGQPVDTTGAGDLYCSGLLYGFSHGYDLKKSMEFASHTSGLCVTYYGGIDEIFSLKNLKFGNSNIE